MLQFALKKVTSNAKDGILRNAIVTVPTLHSFFPEKEAAGAQKKKNGKQTSRRKNEAHEGTPHHRWPDPGRLGGPGFGHGR
jgi:hypothetical protein